MNTAEQIYNEVRTLPEPQAQRVLDFVTQIKAQPPEDAETRRTAALATLAKYRGRYEATGFNRDELYDRKVLR